MRRPRRIPAAAPSSTEPRRDGLRSRSPRDHPEKRRAMGRRGKLRAVITDVQRRNARARARLQAVVRERLGALGYEEVETPCLVPVPAMEPHLHAFEAPFVPEGGGRPRPLFLHASPEYAMKRLLAAGLPRIFQLARVFRNGELSRTHNPEFTLLELYRAGTDYAGVMDDLERLVEACARGLSPDGSARATRGGRALELSAPFERLTVTEAFRRHAGIDLGACGG